MILIYRKKMGNEVEEEDKKMNVNVENVDGEEEEEEKPKLELQPMKFYLETENTYTVCSKRWGLF